MPGCRRCSAMSCRLSMRLAGRFTAGRVLRLAQGLDLAVLGLTHVFARQLQGRSAASETSPDIAAPVTACSN